MGLTIFRLRRNLKRLMEAAYLTGYRQALQDAHNYGGRPLDKHLDNLGETRSADYAERMVP